MARASSRCRTISLCRIQDPHWQVVDSDGNVYLLDRLKTKALIGSNYKKEIVLPSYIKNVSKVVIWCAFVEVNLGEAKFSSPVM